jgi:hypothetical protein
MKPALTLFTLSVFLLSYPVAGAAQQPVKKKGVTQNSGLTVELVVNLVNAGVPAEQIVETIRRTPSDFNLTLEMIDNLRKAGFPTTVLDAMIKARRTGVVGPFTAPTPQPNPPPTPQPDPGAPLPPTNINPAPGATPAATPSTVTPPVANVTRVSAADAQRLQSARIPIRAPFIPPAKKPDPTCSSVAPGKKVHQVDLDYDTGSSSHSHLEDTGLYCFALRNANALYDWTVVVNVSEPTGNPFDLLNDAIRTLKGLATGASDTAAKAAAKPPTPAPANCPSADDIKAVAQKAESLRGMLAGMVPGKGSDGKVAYIPVAETRKRWEEIPNAFNAFEEAVRQLQRKLPANPNDPCDPDLLAQAESIILDDYPAVRKQYEELANRLSRPDVFYYARRLEATSSADLVATPSYAGVADGSKTFHFSPSFGILSSSAGFLLTRLPARSYSSVTAPNPADLTQTQNVLSVDFGAGTRPALVVLLTGNPPQLNRRNFGLGISAGPVFDISQGKADTSRFGFFTGASLRITPWIFLTPGIHFGEFADFPAGFTRPGQVIPQNTGTPVPVKRYTSRFAFSFTFKLKDLGAVISSGGENKNQ